MRLRDDGRRVAVLASAGLSYPEAGATRSALPPGYRHVRRDVSVGHGTAGFDRAVRGLLEWRMHRGAGLGVTATGVTAEPGVVVGIRVGRGPFSLFAPCRVVYRVDESDLRGFAYGTLPGHPERGEEAFLVRLGVDGDVRLQIRAFSRPASLVARLGGPVSRFVQDRVTDGYVRALRNIAAG